MSKFLPAALLALAALLAPASAQTSPAPQVVRIRVEAQPGDQVLLFLGPSLAPPIALPGFTGLLALDPLVMLAVPGAPVDAQGVSLTVLPVSTWPSAWPLPYFQAGIVSPRDAASGQLRPPTRLR
jgi:hypothetical protein